MKSDRKVEITKKRTSQQHEHFPRISHAFSTHFPRILHAFPHVFHTRTTAKAQRIPQGLNATCPTVFQTYRQKRRGVRQCNQKKAKPTPCFLFSTTQQPITFRLCLELCRLRRKCSRKRMRCRRQ